MSCMPVASKIRRIWRKMFSFNKRMCGYEKLSSEIDNKHVENDYDISLDFPAAARSYRTPARDINNNDTFKVRKRNFDDCCGSLSSGYESLSSSSPPPPPFKIFEDEELSRSFDSLLLPLKSYRKHEASTFGLEESSIDYSPPSFSYSPFNSFKFADSSCSKSSLSSFDIDSIPESPESHLLHEELRRDFESNGITKDIDNFLPSAASTPMATKRMQPNIAYYYPMASQFQPMIAQIQPLTTRMRATMPQRYYRSKPAAQPRKKFKPNKKSLDDHCVFCKNNGQDESVYRTHTVKDALGRVLCPSLRLYKCPICGEDGDNSHTVKYCPKKPIVTLDDLLKMDTK